MSVLSFLSQFCQTVACWKRDICQRLCGQGPQKRAETRHWTCKCL